MEWKCSILYFCLVFVVFLFIYFILFFYIFCFKSVQYVLFMFFVYIFIIKQNFYVETKWEKNIRTKKHTKFFHTTCTYTYACLYKFVYNFFSFSFSPKKQNWHCISEEHFTLLVLLATFFFSFSLIHLFCIVAFLSLDMPDKFWLKPIDWCIVNMYIGYNFPTKTRKCLNQFLKCFCTVYIQSRESNLT